MYEQNLFKNAHMFFQHVSSSILTESIYILNVDVYSISVITGHSDL